MATQNLTATEIPTTGYLRIHQVLRFIPIGKSTWWKWCATGRAPAPLKLGAKTTVWKASEISAFINELDKCGGNQ